MRKLFEVTQLSIGWKLENTPAPKPSHREYTPVCKLSS